MAMWELLITVEGMLGNKFPVLLLWKLVNLGSVLIFLAKIQFGRKNNKSTHFNIAEQFEEVLSFPPVIVDHASRNHDIIFFIVNWAGIFLSEDHLFKVFICFLLLSKLQ